jgi:hypothetical protein
LDCYQALEITPRASLNEIRQAHVERVKLWHPDRFTDDPSGAKQAAEKTRELNRALETIGAYFAGTYTETPRPAPKPKQEPRPEPESKPRTEPEPKAQPEPKPRPAAEKRPEPKTAPAATNYPPSVLAGPQRAPWVKWAAIGAVGVVMFALIVGLVILILQRGGATLTDQSTLSQWVRSKEGAKRAYAHYILVELEQRGMLRKTSLRLNDDFFYDGLEALTRDKNPETMDSRLVDLSEKLVSNPK